MSKSRRSRITWYIILAFSVMLIAVRTWRIGWFQGMDFLLWLSAGISLAALWSGRAPSGKDRSDSGAVSQKNM